MSTYTQVNTYTFRDSLAPGDPSKIIYGAFLDAEFGAIHTATLDAASLSGSNTFAAAQVFSSTVTVSSSLTANSAVLGSPTGGNKGAGTLNATALYVNGTAVGTGSGSVTSVTVSSANAAISSSGSPITGSGTITITSNQFTSVAAGHVPASGGGTSTFMRADGTWAQVAASTVTGLATVATSGAYSSLSGTPSLGSVASINLDASTSHYLRGDGTFTTVPTSAITGLATSATTDTTNATNITSGTLAVARMATGYAYSNVSGTPSLATIATSGSASDLGSGTVANARLPNVAAGPGVTIASDPGTTPSGSFGQIFFYY